MPTFTAPPAILARSLGAGRPPWVVVLPSSAQASTVQRTLVWECPAEATETMTSLSDWITKRIKETDLASLVPLGISVLVHETEGGTCTALERMLPGQDLDSRWYKELK